MMMVLNKNLYMYVHDCMFYGYNLYNLDDNIVCMDKIVLDKKCIECIEGEVFWDEGEVR